MNANNTHVSYSILIKDILVKIFKVLSHKCIKTNTITLAIENGEHCGPLM